MASLAETRTPFATAADMLVAAREVPLHRIRMHPIPGSATECDVLQVHERERRLCELIDGILVEKTVGSYESILAGYILTELNFYLDEHDLGVVMGEAGMLRIVPGQIRIPDVAFISWDQIPNRIYPSEAIWGLHPDLAVEVLSRGNSKTEIALKLEEYFAAGAQLAWIVDPLTQTVKVYRSITESRLVAGEEYLDGEDVLPGLSIPLAKIFRRKPAAGDVQLD